MGSLVFQATLGGQVNLNGPNTASTFDIAVPATTGTMVTTGDTGTVTNTMLAGSIANAKLTNSSVTVGSTSIALGATSTTLDGVNIGATTPGTGAFTTLSASSTVSGTGFSTYLASPPAIGGTTAAAGTFTTLSGTTSVTTPIVKSASSLTLQSNGTTTAVTVDTSQNVGIGTTSPSTKLTTYQAGDGLHVKATNNTFYSALGVSAGASAGYFDVASATNMLFTRGGTESMRIDSSGNLLVGNTTGGYGPLRGVNILNQDVGAIIIGHTSGTSSGNGYINFNYNGSAIGSISQNGTTAVSYNTSSDYRLKENITPLTGALAKVAALKPCTYTWKSAPDEVGEGFIAHELAEVCPQAVHGTKDAVDADGNPVYQGIDTSFLVATLTAAIQELTARVDALEAK